MLWIFVAYNLTYARCLALLLYITKKELKVKINLISSLK